MYRFHSYSVFSALSSLRFFHFLGEGRDRTLVHGGDGVLANAVQDRVDGLFAGGGPRAGRGREDVAEADGSGGYLELRAASGAFALLDEAGFVERGKHAAHHDGTGVERLGDGGRGVHGIWFESEKPQDANTQTETTVLSHGKQTNTARVRCGTARLPGRGRTSPLIARGRDEWGTEASGAVRRADSSEGQRDGC